MPPRGQYVVLALALLAAAGCEEKPDPLQQIADSLAAISVDSTTVRIPDADSNAVQDLQRRSPQRGAWANALDVVQPPPPDSLKIAGRFAQMYSLAMRSYYVYYASALKHRREAFDWQLRASKISFVAVILLVLAGVVFSALQFSRRTPDGVSSVKFSSKRIEVSSPILGVTILALSLLFFYLYVIQVYPIREAIQAAG